MLRLSKKADYALLALQHLAREGSSSVASARAIAERFGIPLELLAKILQQLSRVGLVAAGRGIHGGYHLTRPPQTISVAEVVQAIDGHMTLTACSPGDAACEETATRTARDPLWVVRERIRSVLQEVTIADLDGTGSRDVPLTVRRDARTIAISMQTR